MKREDGTSLRTHGVSVSTTVMIASHRSRRRFMEIPSHRLPIASKPVNQRALLRRHLPIEIAP